MHRQPAHQHRRSSHWLVLCLLLLGLLPPSRGQAQSAPPPVTQAARATGDEAPAANRPPTPADADEPATAGGQVYLPLVLADPAPAAPPSPSGGWPRLGIGGTALLGTAPLTVTLQAMLTPPPDQASRADYRFSWSLGDELVAEGAQLTQVYPTPGVYTVTLTAYAGEVAFAMLNEQVTVYDPALVTVGQVDQTGGRVLAREGDLWLDFAPGALAEPHTIFIRQLDLTHVTTDTVDGAPQLVVPSFGLPFRKFSLDACACATGKRRAIRPLRPR